MVYERWSSHHHYDRSFQIDVFSPHWRVGFLFLVLYPPSSASRLPSSRPPLHPPTHPPTHSLSHARTHSLPPSHSLTHTHHSHTSWQAWGNVHCQGVGCTPWRPSGVPWAPPLLRGKRGTMCTAKGSDVRPGVPLVSLGLRCFCVAGCGRRGTMCTGKGSDVRPGVPLVSLRLRRFCVAGVGQCALPRGRMYALASFRCPLASAAFAWQAWDNVHCQGVGCTPWRPSGVPWAPLLLRHRRGTMCTAKGSDVRPGVPLVSLGLRCFCVAGVGQCALPRGRMYAVASLWCPLGSAAFAWQAWDNVHCQGVGCMPWRPSGVPWALPLLRRRRGTMLARGRMYALASLWCPLGSAAFAWQVWDNVHWQGVGCTPWRPSGAPSAAFAWQAWDNVHCQGVGCTPWRPSGVSWAPLLLRGRRGTMCTGKGSDVRPGVPLVSLGLRCFCVAGVGQCALARGRMYWRPSGVPSPPLLLRGRRGTMCTDWQCTPWRPSGVPWAPLLLRGRRGTMCTAKGSDVRPGVPLESLGLRCFCVASVGQCALPRGRMYALASLWCPLGSAAFAWQAWDNRFCVAGLGQCALPRGRMYALLFLILLPSSYSSSRPPTHSHTSLTHHSHALTLT